MKMQKPQMLIITLFLCAGLAGCGGFNLPGISGPKAPCSVTISTQAGDRLSQRFKDANGQKGKPFTVNASSDEVSSLIAQQIDQAKQSSGQSTIPLENPVVCFQNGKMSLFGAIKTDPNNSVNALIAVSAALSGGKAAFKVEQVQIGPLPVPQFLSDQISALINDSINQNLRNSNVTEIKIGDGQMTVSGTAQ